ncbi:MAG: S-methyl-5'-thioadenosine phosphorylase [Defluviitaleaceae bacterium]|nr:S-methyl-5'-thioadenosine phosphorylase [Defluviitaleaceae bacterium]MCL2274736.1 S-methyl-5'-thioadenosine phosphorylase [Defluviitaleaceae bacterium]
MAVKIGIIGGSGMGELMPAGNTTRKEMDTPHGKPSDALVHGTIHDIPVVMLARHAKGHTISPTLVPFRANIWALKEAGCTHILATTACGSLREEYAPGDLVFIDQFIDWTKLRKLSFHEKEVVHTEMATPFDATLRQRLVEAAKGLSLSHHVKGTMITIEGPRFSTRAESHMFRQIGADVINMTTVPECPLAKELGIPYQAIAMVTDYDCWKEGEAPVTYEMVLNTMKNNAEKVRNLISTVIKNIKENGETV